MLKYRVTRVSTTPEPKPRLYESLRNDRAFSGSNSSLSTSSPGSTQAKRKGPAPKPPVSSIFSHPETTVSSYSSLISSPCTSQVNYSNTDLNFIIIL